MDGIDGKLIQLTAVGNVGSGMDDPNKKVRKLYSITKSRKSWSEQEHDKFLEALQLVFDGIIENGGNSDFGEDLSVLLYKCGSY